MQPDLFYQSTKRNGRRSSNDGSPPMDGQVLYWQKLIYHNCPIPAGLAGTKSLHPLISRERLKVVALRKD